MLNQEQKDAFERDGFLVLSAYFSEQQVAEVSTAIDLLASRPPRVGHEMAYYEDSVVDANKRILSRIENFVDEDPVFRKIVFASGLPEIAADLMGSDAALFKEKINFKLPGGQGFAPHQDIQPGWDTYARYFISMLVTVDPSTVENGCLELAAGHHKRGWIGDRFKPLTGEQLKGIEFVKFPTHPGDVVVFDCFTPHQSAANLTSKSRRNLYLTYNRASEGDCRKRYFADKRAAFPPDFERAPGSTYKFKV